MMSQWPFSPPLADLGKENQPVAAANDEDDFVPLKKKPKII